MIFRPEYYALEAFVLRLWQAVKVAKTGVGHCPV